MRIVILVWVQANAVVLEMNEAFEVGEDVLQAFVDVDSLAHQAFMPREAKGQEQTEKQQEYDFYVDDNYFFCNNFAKRLCYLLLLHGLSVLFW